LRKIKKDKVASYLGCEWGLGEHWDKWQHFKSLHVVLPFFLRMSSRDRDQFKMFNSVLNRFCLRITQPVNFHKIFFHTTGVQQGKVGRRRKKTNSTSRSRHSSHSSNQDVNFAGDRINGEAVDIHQLENEAFLEGREISNSFSIEFASSSNKGPTFLKNGFHSNTVEDSASHSVIFRNSDTNQTQVGMEFLAHILML